MTFITREEKSLAPYAAKSRFASRLRLEEGSTLRSAYQEDLYRIVRSRSYRRLAHKTQALSAMRGDHRRTRLTHTLEVSQIGRTLCRLFNLNEDLADAIAMGHDLGHTPFGHCGERMLNSLAQEGFSHQAQSLRVVDTLADGGKGLNLTLECRDGILKHSKGLGPVLPKAKDLPISLEGLVVRISDIIAYLAHDMDDALEAGILSQKDIPIKVLKIFGETPQSRENAMVTDLLANSSPQDNTLKLAFSPLMDEHMEYLRAFLNEKVYRNKAILEDMEKGAQVIKEIYLAIMDSSELYGKLPLSQLASSRSQAACDFISGMTDRFAIDFLKEINS